MGAEISIRRGIGRILIDVRRDGDSFYTVRHFTFAALITTDDLIARSPAQVASIVRAIVKVQKALRANPARAADVGETKVSSRRCRTNCFSRGAGPPILRPED